MMFARACARAPARTRWTPGGDGTGKQHSYGEDGTVINTHPGPKCT